MSKKSKAQRDEERRREAVRKMCLHHFLALSVVFENAWINGLAGGGTEGKTYYMPVTLAPTLVKFASEQWQKIVKWRYRFIQSLGGTGEWERASKGFYRDTEAKLRMIEDATKKVWPDGTREDYLIMQTYLLSCAIYDWRALNDDHRQPLRYMEQALNTLTDRLLPKDSPLVHPMSEAYWLTRDAWQEYPDWTRGGTLEWTPSEQELYEREKRNDTPAATATTK